jgi:hypothetical protein
MYITVLLETTNTYELIHSILSLFPCSIGSSLVISFVLCYDASVAEAVVVVVVLMLAAVRRLP